MIVIVEKRVKDMLTFEERLNLDLIKSRSV